MMSSDFLCGTSKRACTTGLLTMESHKQKKKQNVHQAMYKLNVHRGESNKYMYESKAEREPCERKQNIS